MGIAEYTAVCCICFHASQVGSGKAPSVFKLFYQILAVQMEGDT